MGLFDNLKVLAGGKQTTGGENQAGTSEEKKKVLVLEDDLKLQSILEMKLQLAGLDTSKAEDGQKGLELVQSQKPNLILLDLLMPVMDGRTFLKKLKEMAEYSSIPVIILTNAGSIDNVAELRLYNNVKEFLIKANVTPDEIIDKVHQVI